MWKPASKNSSRLWGTVRNVVFLTIKHVPEYWCEGSCIQYGKKEEMGEIAPEEKRFTLTDYKELRILIIPK